MQGEYLSFVGAAEHQVPCSGKHPCPWRREQLVFPFQSSAGRLKGPNRTELLLTRNAPESASIKLLARFVLGITYVIGRSCFTGGNVQQSMLRAVAGTVPIVRSGDRWPYRRAVES